MICMGGLMHKAAVAAGLGLLCAVAPVAGQEARPVNLLALQGAKLEHASDPAAGAAALKGLTDGDTGTPVVLAGSDKAPLTLVIGFDGKVVSLEQIEVSLGNAAKESAATHVDLLVSSLSPHAGFHSVRSDPLAPTQKAQRFAFGAVGAKWIMLKVSGPPDAQRVSLAEIRIVGRDGPPLSRYKFKESPAKAFDVLRRLQGSAALNLPITPDEASLFADARDGKLDEWSFAEAALLVSGVATAERRKAYLARLDALEAQARAATASAKGPFERGAALLRFLHSGPMAKGYASQQTDLSTVLEKGTFNCVSSAALYNVLARRLGLDARAVEVPDHAFSVVYDGTAHADVETTTAAGFNPARNKSAQAAFEKLTGFVYIPDSHRDRRREVGELGLLAIVYYNHGVELTRQKRYPEALLAYFRAMSLDPEFASAVQNALAVLANWSAELTRQRKFEDALNVAVIGLQLVPQDAALLNNHKAIWSQWADALMKEGRNDDALAVLRRAEQAIPKAGFDSMRAWIFIRQGEEHIKAGNWPAALQVVEPGLAKLDAVPRAELAKWAASLHSRWAESEMRKGNFAGALDIVSRRLTEQPQDRRLANHLAYLVQEQLKHTAAKEGTDAADRMIPQLLARFSQYPDVRKVAAAHLQRRVQVLTDQGKYDLALAAAQRVAELTGDARLAAATVGALYDRWAMKLARAKQWDEALGVYEKALPKLADRGNAENNIRYFVQEWAKEAHARQGMTAAKEMLSAQLKRFAHVQDMHEIASGYVQRSVRELAGKREYDGALAALDTLSGLLRGPDDVARIASVVYDTWSGELSRKGDWQGAVDVYARALERFPRNGHLVNNAEAAWYRWSKPFMDRKDWRGAIGIYEKGLERMPDSSLFKQNLRYCREQLAKGQP
jgi:tetratricopeptide (TPR) repeat protein